MHHVKFQILLETFLLTFTLLHGIMLKEIEEENGKGHKSYEEKRYERPIARFNRA